MKRWQPPADFAHWCVVESLPKLVARYGVTDRTIVLACQRMPDDVQAARQARIVASRLQRLADHNRTRPPAGTAPAVIEIPRPPRSADASVWQRFNDAQFVEHYARVAARRGWNVRAPHSGAGA